MKPRTFRGIGVFVVLVAILVFGVGSIATSKENPDQQNAVKAEKRQLPPGCKQVTTAGKFRTFSVRVWRLIRWERDGGQPKTTTIQAQRHKLRCAAGPEHRKAMKRRWREDKKRFYRHRQQRIEQQRQQQVEAEYLAAITPPGPEVLAAIRYCESHGSGGYSTNTGNGFYGAYQFMQSTWESVGGSGYPHEASPQEQDERAAKLYRISGSSPWPVCGV